MFVYPTAHLAHFELTFSQNHEEEEEEDEEVADPDDTGPKKEPMEIDSPTFSSGSIPIDIVKPSSSFEAA